MGDELQPAGTPQRWTVYARGASTPSLCPNHPCDKHLPHRARQAAIVDVPAPEKVKVTADNDEVLEAVTYVAKPEDVCAEGQPTKD